MYKCLLILGILGAVTHLHAGPELLFTAEKTSRIVQFNAQGEISWEFSPAPIARDVWRLPNGNILFPYSISNGVNNAETGVMEVSPQKKIVWQFKTHGQVYSCQRMANGNTLVGATQQGKVLIVAPDGKIVSSITIKNAAAGHSSMRNVRALADGHFLVAEESAKCAREYDAQGTLLREFKTSFPVYSAVRLPNNHTFTCGKLGMMEFDSAGKPVWSMTDKDVPELGIRWFAGVQILPGGTIFICNAGGKIPFAEINRAKKIVWKPEPGQYMAGAGHGIQVLSTTGEVLK